MSKSAVGIELPKRVAENIDRFTGRAWLLLDILDWLERSNERVFLLTGDPGTGKSSVAAWLAGFGPKPVDPGQALKLESLRGRIKAAHFCVAESGTIAPQALARHIAEQLARKVEGFGQMLIAASGERVQLSVEQHMGRGRGRRSGKGHFDRQARPWGARRRGELRPHTAGAAKQAVQKRLLRANRSVGRFSR
jgi:hypothetical protein